MTKPEGTLRLATLDDAPALEALIPRSVRVLQAKDYTPSQLEAAIGPVFGLDRALVEDGTYFVAEIEGRIVGCGGWSRRATLFGVHTAIRNDAYLRPGIDPAKIRAFFIDPDYSRRGIGSLILEASERAAAAAGFTQIELAATLTGIPLYERHGYRPLQRFETPLANGEGLPILGMIKDLV
jgi:GNAT superfamily N-acetyltransferase